jgi:hypothetical protein
MLKYMKPTTLAAMAADMLETDGDTDQRIAYNAIMDAGIAILGEETFGRMVDFARRHPLGWPDRS